MKKFLVSMVGSLALASALNAVSFDKESIELKFEGFKSESMIGTSGVFQDVKYDLPANESSIAKYLTKAKATVNPSSAYLGEGFETATDNMVKVFFPTFLGKQNITALIENVVEGDNKGLLSVRVSIGKESTLIPLTYVVENNKFEAKGQLDLSNFKNSSKALKALSDAAPGHGGLSWPLVDLVFSANLK